MLKVCQFCKYPFVSPVIIKDKIYEDGTHYQQISCRMCGATVEVTMKILHGPVRKIEPNSST